MPEKEIDCRYTREIVCPYCGWIDRDSWEADDDGEMDCGECEKTFHFERRVTVKYISYKMEDLKQ